MREDLDCSWEAKAVNVGAKTNALNKASSNSSGKWSSLILAEYIGKQKTQVGGRLASTVRRIAANSLIRTKVCSCQKTGIVIIMTHFS